MGKLADRAQQYLEQRPPDHERTPAPARFQDGEQVTVTDNQGRTRSGIVSGATWQEPSTPYLAGWWYWIESDQGDSWTHESRLNPTAQGNA